MSDRPSNILFCRQDRLGDLILSFPLAAAVKHKYPDWKVGFMVSEANAEIASMCDQIDEVWPANLGTKLDKEKLKQWDTVVVLYPEASLARQLFFANIKKRVGTSRRSYSFFFNVRINVPRSGSHRHETDLNFDLLSALFPVDKKQRPTFTIPKESTQQITDLLIQLGIPPDQKLAILHPGSGGSSRDWPVEQFAKLANVLQNRADTTVLVTGTEDEVKLAKEVMGKNSKKIFSLAGQTTLSALTALLAISGLCVANSTGPLHLANALKTPSVGLFPPLKDCDPSRWGVLDYPERSLTPFFPDDQCPFCENFECRTGECMSLIAVERVLEVAEPLLETQNSWSEKTKLLCVG
ncbi:MAG: glycosyltransferase family 9 protein [bacterium]|nr:glycosyltransferase family 9 protein [bacterium]